MKADRTDADFVLDHKGNTSSSLRNLKSQSNMREGSIVYVYDGGERWSV